MPPSKWTYAIADNNIVSDKGARIKLKITRPTHTSNSSVGDLTTAVKKIILTLVASSNNNKIDNPFHHEDNAFVS